MNGGYAQFTAQGIYGTDPAMVPAAYGVAIPAGAMVPAGTAASGGQPGTGTLVSIPRDFWRSSGFGLLLLVLLVVYFDVRLLNR